MANRVFDTLAKWTALDDAALDAEIAKIEGRRPEPARRVHARRLFAQALDTPGGLKVQTIHAFCTRLLHQFPFEANVAARFEVLEERARSELIDRLRMGVLLEAAAKPDSALGRALATAIALAADRTFTEVIGEMLLRHEELTDGSNTAGGVAHAIRDLSGALGVDPTKRRAVDRRCVRSDSLPSHPNGRTSQRCAGARLGRRQGAVRRASTRRGARQRADRERIYRSSARPSSSRARTIVTQTIRDKHPGLFERLLAEQERVCALITRRRAVETRERTAALVTIAAEVIARYRAEKNSRGLLDYDDLIDKTLRAAQRATRRLGALQARPRRRPPAGRRGAGHEPEAMGGRASADRRVLRRCRRARTVTRTVFAVGDEKQSIFSFQGAEPRVRRMRRHYASVCKRAELRFADVKFQYSFRSAPNVLDAVDACSPRARRTRA